MPDGVLDPEPRRLGLAHARTFKHTFKCLEIVQLYYVLGYAQGGWLLDHLRHQLGVFLYDTIGAGLLYPSPV